MTMLSGQDAALIANAVYTIMPATTNAQAQQFAQRDPTLAGRPHSSGATLSENVRPIGGMVGNSGAFVRETTGFGMVLERGPSTNRELIVSIRGTQSGYDWLSNFNIGFEAGPSGSIVHAGFNRIYRSMVDELSRVVSAARPQKIHFVGHSLGGALASIAAADFAGTRGISSTLATFGAPRVGSIGLTQTLRTCLPAGSVRRVYALADPVPMIPLLPFMHYPTGSTAVNANYGRITADAHSMDLTYIPRMPHHGWPAEQRLPNLADADYWLDQAERAPGIFSAAGYWALGHALEAILAAANVVGLTLTVGMTVLDRIIQAMTAAVRIVAEAGETLVRWAAQAIRWATGRAVEAGLSAADITRDFLETVLEMLMEPVRLAARMARDRFT